MVLKEKLIMGKLTIFAAIFSLCGAALAQPLTIPEVGKQDQICFALYTTHNNILKLTAQLYPLADEDDRTVRLEIMKDGNWTEIANTEVIEEGWTAPFRVEDWDMSSNYQYRVAHGESAYFSGTIKKDPVDKEIITVAGFTGNSINERHGGDISRNDIIENIKKIKPDLLFFSGDQVYNHTKHLAAWLKFGCDFGEIIKDIPTVTIPDDHDVGQGNIWGAGGKKASTQAGSDGGYFAPVDYVKMVERAQTSHLPDPYDPTPVQRGIGVYYTALKVGRVSFAIVEDRKFKTGPEGVVPRQGPRPDHILNPDYDPKTVDVPGAKLLGERQLKFLHEWGQDWSGADMKCVLSQTVFANAATIHGQKENRLHADLDSNGWPQTGRNKAIDAMRKAFALHLCGDQHLGTIIHHGIEDWNDGNVSFCVPSIANLYLRWWDPLEAGKNQEPWMPRYLGEFKDGLGNKINVLACANPNPEENHDKLTTRAAGFGIVKFNVKTRQISLECWPRNVDVSLSNSKQYLGWPRTFNQLDNYGQEAVAYLPLLEIEGETNPVVQLIDENNNQVVYTLRINGNSFRAKVFKRGKYTLKIGEGKNIKIIRGVEPVDPGKMETLKIEL